MYVCYGVLPISKRLFLVLVPAIYFGKELSRILCSRQTIVSSQRLCSDPRMRQLQFGLDRRGSHHNILGIDQLFDLSQQPNSCFSQFIFQILALASTDPMFTYKDELRRRRQNVTSCMECRLVCAPVQVPSSLCAVATILRTTSFAFFNSSSVEMRIPAWKFPSPCNVSKDMGRIRPEEDRFGRDERMLTTCPTIGPVRPAFARFSCCQFVLRTFM